MDYKSYDALLRSKNLPYYTIIKEFVFLGNYFWGRKRTGP